MTIRKHILKETLKRPFVTTHLSNFIFRQFMQMLNTGLLFKDITFYSPFSKRADLVSDFYLRYFEQESIDLGKDILSLLKGLGHFGTNP